MSKKILCNLTKFHPTKYLSSLNLIIEMRYPDKKIDND